MDARDLPQHSLFISYAHEDAAFVAQLRKFFMPFDRTFGCKVLWDDTQIRTGDAWLAEIERALSKARFAVLLMSVDFMASSFITNNELPRLRARERAGELTILPMLVGPVDLELSGVADLQFVNPPEEPLMQLDAVQQQRLYVKLAKRVKAELLRLVDAANDGSPGPETVAGGAAQGLILESRAVDDKVSPDVSDGDPEPVPGELAEWGALVPPHMAVAEIESQLLRLKQHTRSLGFAVFDCDSYYVQFLYHPALDESSVVVEVLSNVYLEKGRRLGKLQLQHLTGELNFVQATPEENLLKCVPMRDAADIAELARESWAILTELYPSEEGKPLSIDAKCR